MRSLQKWKTKLCELFLGHSKRHSYSLYFQNTVFQKTGSFWHCCLLKVMSVLEDTYLLLNFSNIVALPPSLCLLGQHNGVLTVWNILFCIHFTGVSLLLKCLFCIKPQNWMHVKHYIKFASKAWKSHGNVLVKMRVNCVSIPLLSKTRLQGWIPRLAVEWGVGIKKKHTFLLMTLAHTMHYCPCSFQILPAVLEKSGLCEAKCWNLGSAYSCSEQPTLQARQKSYGQDAIIF